MPIENSEPNVQASRIDLSNGIPLPLVRKSPATELLDQEFHAMLLNSQAITTFDTWEKDCYNAVLTFCRATDVEEKKRAALRIAQIAWEAADEHLSVGHFLSAISANWASGLKDGRKAFDWMMMNWNMYVEGLYVAKTMRHLIQADTSQTPDLINKHLAALFCNANILWRRCGDLHE